MEALGDEARERVRRVRNGIRPRNGDGVEAAKASLLDERALERDRIVQKSRSA
jgi:hypothetical protein